MNIDETLSPEEAKDLGIEMQPKEMEGADAPDVDVQEDPADASA